MYQFNRQQLKRQRASSFKEKDVIKTGKYYIFIKYGNYDTPALCSEVSSQGFKLLDCVAGCGRPYYIDDFLNR